MASSLRFLKLDNVRDNRAAGDVEIVGADIIAKLSAETSLGRAPAASCSSHCYPLSSGGATSVRSNGLIGK